MAIWIFVLLAGAIVGVQGCRLFIVSGVSRSGMIFQLVRWAWTLSKLLLRPWWVDSYSKKESSTESSSEGDGVVSFVKFHFRSWWINQSSAHHHHHHL